MTQNLIDELPDSDQSSEDDVHSTRDVDENSREDDQVEQDDGERKQAREGHFFSVFEPHRGVQIEDPCLGPLEEDGVGRFPSRYDAEGDRWYHEFPEPYPLVPGTVGQHNLAKSGLETPYRADKGLYPKSVFEEDEDDLYMWKAVDVATQYGGRTRISVAVIELKRDDDEEEQQKTMLIRWEIELLRSMTTRWCLMSGRK